MIPNARILTRIFLGLALAGSTTTLLAQSGVISSDSLTPFDPRDVGTSSEARTVRVRLNHPLAITSLAIAPGFTDFSAGAITGCAIDDNTINPVFTVCEVSVTFTPKYPGQRSAPLVVTDNTGAKYSIGLQGTGLAPQAALTPGIINHFAGGNSIYSGDGGPASQAGISTIFSITFDSAGNTYLADGGDAAPPFTNRRIRKIDSSGIITTVLGPYGNPDGPASLAINSKGEILFRVNCKVNKLDLNGQITLVAGSSTCGFSGDGGPATSAKFSSRASIVLDAQDNLYIADDFNFRVRKVDAATGIITTVAGGGSGFYGGDGGPATEAAFQYIPGIAVDPAGNLYIVDSYNQRIRKVDTNGIVTTIAGNGTVGFAGDGGPATAAQLNYPSQIALDAAGDIYFVDNQGIEIRRIDTNGAITRVAGLNFPQSSQIPIGNGGPATKAVFITSTLGVDPAGNLYFYDLNDSELRKIDISQSAAPFAAHAVGTTSPAIRVVLTNTGNQHMNLGALNITGAFDFLSGTDPSYCSTNPDIGPGFSCALPITFSPTATGPFTGTAAVTDNSLNQPGTTQSISLTGAGANP